MKASDLVNNLQALIAEYGDLDLIYSTDDEGNGYDLIHYAPSVYQFIERDNVISQEQCTEDDIEFIPNAICVN